MQGYVEMIQVICLLLNARKWYILDSNRVFVLPTAQLQSFASRKHLVIQYSRFFNLVLD